jgi:hypothetical protein
VCFLFPCEHREPVQVFASASAIVLFVIILDLVPNVI